MLAAPLAVVPALSGGNREGWLIAFGVVGVLAILVALAGWVGATWWGVLALGAEYVVVRAGRGPVDVGAAYVGAGLFLLAELVLWSLDARSRVVSEPEVTRRRLAQLGVLALASLIAGSLIVAAGQVRAGDALARTLVGVLGAVAIVAAVAWVARAAHRRTPAAPDPSSDV